MTSKEAIDYIKNHGVWKFAGIHGWTTPDEKLIKAFEVIKKDLELLELLKPIIKASIEMSDLGISNSKLFLGINGNKLLKEWL